MTTSEETPQSKLTPAEHAAVLLEVLRRLDERRPDTTGYIAYNPEIVTLLNSLTRTLPANVMTDERPWDDEVHIMVKFGFTLSRSEIAEYATMTREDLANQ